MLPEMIKVESSCIDSVGYKDNELYIQYNSGKLYVYEKVSEDTYNQLLDAESKGKYINAYIKPRYVCRIYFPIKSNI